MTNQRSKSLEMQEIEFGKKIAKQDTEMIWGWATPAGRLRAQRRAQLIAQGGKLSANRQVLEIGCGTGLFTALFRETGAKLLAADVSAELIEKALQRNLPAQQVQFIVKSFADCHDYGPFDAIIGSSVLHHLDLENSCRQLFALLKPGGSISFAEPNYLNPQIFIERKFRKLFPKISPGETACVRWQMKRTLLRTGFEKVKITPFDWLHPATPERLIPLIRFLGYCWENIPVLREFAGSLLICAQRPWAR